MPEARAELDKEIRHSKKKYGLDHARQYKQEMMEKIVGICRNPLMHRTIDEVLEGLRIYNYKGNKLLFDVDVPNKTVIILAILGNRQSVEGTVDELRKRRK